MWGISRLQLSVARHIQDAGFDNVITDATIRNFITTKQIGCVGKFWGRKTSATSAHNITCSTNTNTDQSKSVWIVYVTYMYPLNINNTRTIKNWLLIRSNYLIHLYPFIVNSTVTTSIDQSKEIKYVPKLFFFVPVRHNLIICLCRPVNIKQIIKYYFRLSCDVNFEDLGSCLWFA